MSFNGELPVSGEQLWYLVMMTCAQKWCCAVNACIYMPQVCIPWENSSIYKFTYVFREERKLPNEHSFENRFSSASTIASSSSIVLSQQDSQVLYILKFFERCVCSLLVC